MKNVLFVLVSVLVIGVLGVTSAQGMTLSQAEAAGFTCVNVGDDLGHCINERSDNAKATTVLVFDSTASGATLIATEILLAPDVYGGQPCPTEGADEWLDLEFARACHHYVGPR